METELRIYTDSPSIYLAEAFGPHEFDGSILIELEFEDMDDDIKMTQEAASNMAATLFHLLEIEEEEMPASTRVMRGMAFSAILAASAATSVTIFGGLLYLSYRLLLQ